MTVRLRKKFSRYWLLMLVGLAMGSVAGSESSSPLAEGQTEKITAKATTTPVTVQPSFVVPSSEYAIEDSLDLSLLPQVPLRTQTVPLQLFARESILNDFDRRISEEFAIPDNLRDRVGFWFDIYSQYTSNQRVIHHSRFPWIVFKVVDVTSILNADAPRVQWLRNEKADKIVKTEMAKIREAAASLARRPNPANPTEYQKLVMNTLAQLPGPLKKRAAEAVHDIRIQTGQRDFFADGLSNSPLYLQGMEDVFREHGIPVELTRIPFVESSFNKHATSKVGASGVWQFMSGTGGKFMIVNNNIDERRSPFKSSVAAARLLRENYLILKKSWPLAITAWNHGPPGMRKAMQRAGSRDLGEIVARYRSRSFDFASSNFYSEFLAALYTERYSNEIFGPYGAVKPLDLRSARLTRAMRAQKLLKATSLSKDDFILYNPDLKGALASNSFVPTGFNLMLTEQSLSQMKGVVTLIPGPLAGRGALAWQKM